MDVENSRLTGTVPGWERILTQPIISVVMLAILCLGLHHSALSGGWRFDDGPHLYFVARYSPWEYFFVPEIMREQSWAHITPWNAFFYEIGLPFFGLNPAGHYAHLLLILWLSAVATYFLLRLWLTPLSALMGSALFLAMPATGAIGQMLMTGHYAYGLLFTVLTLYFFARGVREHRVYFSFLAAGFYALACLSKELYVPIIAVLLFLPVGSWKERFGHLWAILLIAITYTVIRLTVLHGLGGYARPPLSGSLSTEVILVEFLLRLFDSKWIGVFVAAYISISAFIALYIQKRPVNLLLLLSILVVVSVPIIPILQSGFSNILSLRFLFLACWSLAILMAWFTNNSKIHAMILLFFVTAFAFSQQKTNMQIANIAKTMEQQNYFLTREGAEQILLPYNFAELHYLESIRNATILLNQIDPPIFLRDEEELARLSNEQHSRLFQFDHQCQCILQMSKESYRKHVDNFRTQLAAGADQSMNILLEIEDQGLRKIFRWQIESDQNNFEIYFPEYGSFSLPLSGELPFGLDITGPPRRKDLHVYIQVRSPEGWIARSPRLKIDSEISNRVSWSGKSVVDWPDYKNE